MVITRKQLFIFGLLILLTPPLAWRLAWMAGSVKTTGHVTEIRTTRRWDNTFPVIEFSAKGSVIRFRGFYNAPYNVNDEVPVRYIPNNPSSCRIDKFWTIWIEVIIIDIIITMIWCFLFGRRIITGKKFQLGRWYIREIREFSRSTLK